MCQRHFNTESYYIKDGSRLLGRIVIGGPVLLFRKFVYVNHFKFQFDVLGIKFGRLSHIIQAIQVLLFDGNSEHDARACR